MLGCYWISLIKISHQLIIYDYAQHNFTDAFHRAQTQDAGSTRKQEEEEAFKEEVVVSIESLA